MKEKIKLNVRQALQSVNAIQQFNSKAFPMMLGLKLASNQRKLEEVSREFHSRRDEILKKYGTPNDQGGYKIDPKKIDTANAELSALEEEELELEMAQIGTAELPRGLEPEPRILVPLDWMIIENGEPGDGNRNRKKK